MLLCLPYQSDMSRKQDSGILCPSRNGRCPKMKFEKAPRGREMRRALTIDSNLAMLVMPTSAAACTRDRERRRHRSPGIETSCKSVEGPRTLASSSGFAGPVLIVCSRMNRGTLSSVTVDSQKRATQVCPSHDDEPVIF